MKWILVLALFTSTLVFAESNTSQTCLSHGECQTKAPVLDSKCMIIKLPSPNPDGSVACTLRCPAVLRGSYCEFFEGKAFGICRKESFPLPVFDPTDCSGALDPTDLP